MGNVNHKVHETTADHAIPLSSDGFMQAAKAGNWLKDNLPDRSSLGFFSRGPKRTHRRLWSSPYLRTRQTAKVIHEVVGEPLITDYKEHVLLCEQQFGLFDGVPDEELPVKYPNEHAHYAKCEKFEGRFFARLPLGESRFDVAQRVHQAFGTLHRDAQRNNIHDLVIVAHGVTIRAFVMMWFNLPYEWFEAEPNPKNCSIRHITDGKDKGYVFTP